MSDKMTPEIRFKGFYDDWEQRKLGEVTNYIKGFAFKSKDYRGSGVRIIRVSDLSRDNIKYLDDSIFISNKVAGENAKYKIKSNEIIITTVGSKNEMKNSAVGRPIWISKDEQYLLNQNLVKLSMSQKYDSYFIFCQLLRPKYGKYIATIERGNANQANIAINDLWRYRFFIPNEDEQIELSKLLKSLNNTIALHQQKIDKLQQIKKAYLQKMFI